jgi:CheY-like chemotaxis protein
MVSAMCRILLVEDNELNRDMLSQRLIRKGYQVVAATTGAEAISAAAAELPDIVLMDLSLPGMDGLEATRHLKSNPLTERIPVIALTGWAAQEDRDRAIAAGCDEFDTKPIDLARLLEKIVRCTARRP